LDVLHIANRYFNCGVLAVSKIFATLVELCDKIGIDSSLVTSEEGSAFMVSDLVKFLILEFEEAMLAFLFLVQFINFVIDHFDRFETVFNFVRHSVYVLGKFKLEFSLLGVFEIALLGKTWRCLISHLKN
jgi:hypothetical protein